MVFRKKGLGGMNGKAKRRPELHRYRIDELLDKITNPAFKRLTQVAGIKTISGLIPTELRGIINVSLTRLMKDTLIYTRYGMRRTVSASDVEHALNDIPYLKVFTVYKGKVKPCGQVKKVKRNNALREIKYLQKQSDCLHLPQAPFVRVIKRIAMDFETDLRYSKDALNLIQFAIEDYLIQLLEHTNHIAIHDKRTTVYPKDIQLARYIRMDRR